MIAKRKTLWTILCGIVAFWWSTSSTLVCQPIPEPSDPNILRVVLRMEFNDAGVARNLQILNTSERLGVLRGVPIERLARSQFEEIRTGSAVLVRYAFEADNAVVESGHFLVGRRAHAELLDARRGGIVRRLEGSMNEVTVRVPIPLHRGADKLNLGIVDSTHLWELENLDEAVVVSTASADLPLSSSASQVSSSLLDNHLVGNELIHPSNGVANPGGFNIVFLGDGFTENSLWLYQQEVEAIKEEITENSYPLSGLEHALNIWRVDIVTTEDRTSDNLPDEGVDVPVMVAGDEPHEDRSCNPLFPPVNRPNVLGTHFCGKLSGAPGPEFMILGTKDWDAIYAFADVATQYYDDHIIVLAHSAEFGGAGYWTSDDPASEVTGPVAFASIASGRGCAPEAFLGSAGMAETGSSGQGCGDSPQGIFDDPKSRSMIHSMAVHELGHAAFELGDEYCNAVEVGLSWYCEASAQYGGLEPWHSNVTRASSFSELESAGKWSGLVVPSGEVAFSHRVPGCAAFQCPQQCGCCFCPDECACPAACDCPDSGCPGRLVSPLPPDLVGLFEGATFKATEYGCGLFRPRHECKMNWETKVPFCPVCRDAILKVVAPYVGGRVYVLLDSVTVENFGASAEPDNRRGAELSSRDLRSTELEGGEFKFQVAAVWEPPASGPVVAVNPAEIQPAPGILRRYGPDLFLSFERLLAVLHSPSMIPPPKIQVSYRVFNPDSTQLTSGSFNLEPETGVHIRRQPVPGRPETRLRFTISVVDGGP
jgi:hypothetical protein